MRTRWVRREPSRRDNVQAAAVSTAVSLTVAVGVGALTFYVARLLLAREEITKLDDQKLLDAPAD